MVSWMCALKHAAFRGKSTVSTKGNVEIGGLKKKDNLAVQLTSSLVLQRCFFVSLKVLAVAEQPNMKVMCL